MNPEPKKLEPCEKDEDEVTMARSILDEIIEETEKEKPQDKPAAERQTEKHPN